MTTALALRRHFGVPGDGGDPVQHAVDLGPLRLVVLDTKRNGEERGQLDTDRLGWLEATLAAAPEAPTLWRCITRSEFAPSTRSCARRSREGRWETSISFAPKSSSASATGEAWSVSRALRSHLAQLQIAALAAV
jgi:hypothetical protein